MPHRPDDASAKGGDDTRPLGTDELTEDQSRAIARFEELLAQHTGQRPDAGQSANDPFVNRHTFEAAPLHRVILFDGKRGTGKTATMLSALARLVEEPDRAGRTRSLAAHLALTPVSFDDVPDDTHAFAFLATAIARVVDWLAACDGVPTACERRELQRQFRTLCETTLGWGRPGHEGRSLADVVAEQLEADKGWHGLRARWRAFLDMLFRDLEATGRLTSGGLLLMPIDDLDLQPGRARELLLAIRMISHQRLLYVMTGDSAHLGDLLAWEIEGELRGRTRLGVDGPESLRERAADLARAQLLKAIPPANTVPLPLWSLATFLELTQSRLQLADWKRKPKSSGNRRKDHDPILSTDHFKKYGEKTFQLMVEHISNPKRAKHNLTARRASAMWQQLEALQPGHRKDPVAWLTAAYVLLAEDWKRHGPSPDEQHDGTASLRAFAFPSLRRDDSGLFLRPPLTWKVNAGEDRGFRRLDEVGQLLAEASRRDIRPRWTLHGRELDSGLLDVQSPREAFATSRIISMVVGRALPLPQPLETALTEAMPELQGAVEIEQLRDRVAQEGVELVEKGAIAASGAAVAIGNAATSRLPVRPPSVEPHLLLWLAAPESGLSPEDRRDIALGFQLDRHEHADAPAPTNVFTRATRLRHQHLTAEVSLLRGDSSDGADVASALDAADSSNDGQSVWTLLGRLPGPSVLDWSTAGRLPLGNLFRARVSWTPEATHQTLPEWFGFGSSDEFTVRDEALLRLGRTLLQADNTRATALTFTDTLTKALPNQYGRTVADELIAFDAALREAAPALTPAWHFALDDQGVLEVYSDRQWDDPATLDVFPSGFMVAHASAGSVEMSLPTRFMPRVDGTPAQAALDPLLLVAFDLQRALATSWPGVDFEDQPPILMDVAAGPTASIPWPESLSYREATTLVASLRAYAEEAGKRSGTNERAERRLLLIAVVQFVADVLAPRGAPRLLRLQRTATTLEQEWKNAVHQGNVDSSDHRYGRWLRSAGWVDFLRSDEAFLDAFNTRPGAS